MTTYLCTGWQLLRYILASSHLGQAAHGGKDG